MVVKMVQSSVTRMNWLIEDIMDFARGRLGGGVVLQRTDTDPLESVLRQVVTEVEASAPERSTKANFELTLPVHCDHRRIGQLVANLLVNAVTHGAPDQPILFDATTASDCLNISVANGGRPIPDDALERLFQPFTRGDPLRRDQGLGIFIAQQIAKAHGGKITMVSTSA
jgi:sigma-B regulation protein RsbU (phosphoserine phosphatase)